MLSQRENRYDPLSSGWQCAITFMNMGGPASSTGAMINPHSEDDANVANDECDRIRSRAHGGWGRLSTTGWVVPAPSPKRPKNTQLKHSESPTVYCPGPFPVKTSPDQIGLDAVKNKISVFWAQTLGPPAAETFEGPQKRKLSSWLY